VIAEQQAIIALGSNVGDSRTMIRSAMDRLQMLSRVPLRRSSLWQTPPVDCPAGSPWFVNAVAGLVAPPAFTPETMLEHLQALEKEFGRQPKKILNEPRPLDLDLIAFGAEVRTAPNLVLPHPRALQRRFVLQPLAEILPDLVLPGQTRTIAECLGALETASGLIRLEAPRTG